MVSLPELPTGSRGLQHVVVLQQGIAGPIVGFTVQLVEIWRLTTSTDSFLQALNARQSKMTLQPVRQKNAVSHWRKAYRHWSGSCHGHRYCVNFRLFIQ